MGLPLFIFTAFIFVLLVLAGLMFRELTTIWRMCVWEPHAAQVLAVFYRAQVST